MATQGWVSPATAWLTVALDFSATLLPTPASPPAPPFRMPACVLSAECMPGYYCTQGPQVGECAPGHRGLGCRLFGRWPVRRRAHVRGTGADRCVRSPGSGDLSAGCTQSTDCMAGLLCFVRDLHQGGALATLVRGRLVTRRKAAHAHGLVSRYLEPAIHPAATSTSCPSPTTFVARTARST